MGQKRTYCNEIMLFIAKMLSVHTVSCVHQSDNGVKKSWLDSNLQVRDDGIVSESDCRKRKSEQNNKTSWEPTENLESTFFDDKNMTLCMRLPSPIDNLDDLYYVTIRPTLGSININVSSGYETKVTIQDKEIIASLCYSASISMIETKKQIEAKTEVRTQMLMEDIRHKDRTIAELKREMEVPASKTMKMLKEKLFALGKQYGKEFSLSKDAERMANNYAGDNIAPLLNALERAVIIKSEVYSNSQIVIDDADLQIKYDEKEDIVPVHQENILEKRHAKIIAYLERLEDAYNVTVEKGMKTTAMNISANLGVSPASITMWFKKHSEDARRMCEANINLCKNSRKYFEPLKESIAGGKKHAMSA